MPSVTKRNPYARTPRGEAEAQIFAAVERLLAQGESYTSLGMQRIADEAGVARSTMYVHFTDKSDLLMRVTESATAELFGVAEEWVRSGRGAGGLDALEETQRAIIAQHRAHGPLIRALTEVAGYDPVVAEFWRARVDGFAATLQTALEGDQREGRTPAALDAEVAARFISWATERTLYWHTTGEDDASDERLALGMAQVVWRVISADE